MDFSWPEHHTYIRKKKKKKKFRTLKPTTALSHTTKISTSTSMTGTSWVTFNWDVEHTKTTTIATTTLKPLHEAYTHSRKTTTRQLTTPTTIGFEEPESDFAEYELTTIESIEIPTVEDIDTVQKIKLHKVAEDLLDPQNFEATLKTSDDVTARHLPILNENENTEVSDLTEDFREVLEEATRIMVEDEITAFTELDFSAKNEIFAIADSLIGGDNVTTEESKRVTFEETEGTVCKQGNNEQDTTKTLKRKARMETVTTKKKMEKDNGIQKEKHKKTNKVNKNEKIDENERAEEKNKIETNEEVDKGDKTDENEEKENSKPAGSKKTQKVEEKNKTKNEKAQKKAKLKTSTCSTKQTGWKTFNWDVDRTSRQTGLLKSTYSIKKLKHSEKPTTTTESTTVTTEPTEMYSETPSVEELLPAQEEHHEDSADLDITASVAATGEPENVNNDVGVNEGTPEKLDSIDYSVSVESASEKLENADNNVSINKVTSEVLESGSNDISMNEITSEKLESMDYEVGVSEVISEKIVDYEVGVSEVISEIPVDNDVNLSENVPEKLETVVINDSREEPEKELQETAAQASGDQVFNAPEQVTEFAEYGVLTTDSESTTKFFEVPCLFDDISEFEKRRLHNRAENLLDSTCVTSLGTTLRVAIEDEEIPTVTETEFRGLPSIVHDIGEFNRSRLFQAAEDLLTTSKTEATLETTVKYSVFDVEESFSASDYAGLPSIVQDIGEFNKSRLFQHAEDLMTTTRTEETFETTASFNVVDVEESFSVSEFAGLPTLPLLVQDIGEFNKSRLFQHAEDLLTTQKTEFTIETTVSFKVLDVEESFSVSEYAGLPSIVQDIGEINKKKLHDEAERLLTATEHYFTPNSLLIETQSLGVIIEETQISDIIEAATVPSDLLIPETTKKRGNSTPVC